MRERTKLFLPVYLPTFVLSFAQGMLIPTLPLYAQTFDPSFSLISLVVSAAGFGTLVADVPAGALLERIGRKRSMMVGTASLGISYLGLAIAVAYPQLIALRLVAGIGTALWGVSRMAYLADNTTPAERGRALSTFGGVNRIGTFVGPAIGGGLAVLFGLRAPFYAAAVLALVATIVSALFIQSTGAPVVLKGHHKMRWSALGRLARASWRDLLTAGMAQLFAQMIRSGRQIVVPLYGATVLGLDAAQVGSVVSISAAIDMTLFLPAGMLMDRFGRKFASVPSFAVMSVGMALIPFASDYTGLLVATGIIGLGNGLGSGTMMTLGADLAPREAVGEFMGLWRLISDTGQTGGPLVVGGLADAIGLGASALALAAIGITAAVTLTFFVKETLQAEGAPSG